MKDKIHEIVVVEGKDDTRQLQRFFEVDTIETGGSAINEQILTEIIHAQEVRGVIVLTDPDFPGEKIRKTIMEAVPAARHAFIERVEGVPQKKNGSLGVEHASYEALKAALLGATMEPVQVSGHAAEDIPASRLLAYGLIGGPSARKRRERLGDLLRIGYTNSKQLKKRLSMFQVTASAFESAMEKVLKEEQGDRL